MLSLQVQRYAVKRLTSASKIDELRPGRRVPDVLSLGVSWDRLPCDPDKDKLMERGVDGRVLLYIDVVIAVCPVQTSQHCVFHKAGERLED